MVITSTRAEAYNSSVEQSTNEITSRAKIAKNVVAVFDAMFFSISFDTGSLYSQAEPTTGFKCERSL